MINRLNIMITVYTSLCALYLNYTNNLPIPLDLERVLRTFDGVQFVSYDFKLHLLITLCIDLRHLIYIHFTLRLGSYNKIVVSVELQIRLRTSCTLDTYPGIDYNYLFHPDEK